MGAELSDRRSTTASRAKLLIQEANAQVGMDIGPPTSSGPAPVVSSSLTQTVSDCLLGSPLGYGANQAGCYMATNGQEWSLSIVERTREAVRLFPWKVDCSLALLSPSYVLNIYDHLYGRQ